MQKPDYEELVRLLEEAEETIRAIKNGEVDACVVYGADGPLVYTLTGSDRIYRLMVEQMIESAVIMNSDGTILYCNANFGRLVGEPIEKIIGTYFSRFVAEDNRPIFDGLFRKGVVQGARGEISLGVSPEKSIPVHLAINAIQQESGPVISLLATDLSRRKQDEQILAEGRLASTILENVAEATLVCDTSGTIIRASNAAFELCGGNPLQRSFEEVFPLEINGTAEMGPSTSKSEGILQNVSLTTLPDGIYRRKTLFRRNDGRVFYLLLKVRAFQNEKNEIYGWVVSLADITDIKHLTDSLHQAKIAADAANKAKSAFLSNMSHEIRTPMNGVLGMTDLALRKSSNPRVREYLEYVKESGLHLLDIINDILDLARIESGKIELTREKFSLEDLLDSTTESLRPGFAAKSLDLEIHIDPAVPDRVIGDQSRLRQVFTNLIGNALKFTEQGRVSISVGLSRPIGADNRMRLLVGVRDTGIGIPPQNLKTIFDSFEQVDTAYHAKCIGTGLGLSISRSLVELMGGELWVESREGVGSTFFFTADLETPPMGKVEPTTSVARKGGGTPLNVLVAEDVEINRIYIQALLEEAGHAVVMVGTGRQALEKLSQDNFDVVLMDIRMPEMDGDEAVRIIRNNPPQGVNPKVPVIALTAYALANERERFMESGFDAYLTKPVEIEELNLILAELH